MGTPDEEEGGVVSQSVLETHSMLLPGEKDVPEYRNQQKWEPPNHGVSVLGIFSQMNRKLTHSSHLEA